MAYAPATRGPQMPAPPIGIPSRNPKIGSGGSGPTIGFPDKWNPTPFNAPSNSPYPAINGGAYASAPATRDPGVGYVGPADQYTPPTNLGPGRFEYSPEGNFLAGDPAAYASWYAGAYPNGTVGTYSDAQSLADRNTAQNNYGAAAANLDRSEGSIKTSFEEMLNLLNKNKTRNLGSLADSMADRGLTNSGIYLGSTNDLQENYANQLSGQTRQRDQQLGDIQGQRVNIANLLAQAQAQADQSAYARRLQAWNDMYNAGLRQAQDALKAQGLL